MTVLIDSWAWIEYWKGGKHSEAATKHIEGKEEAVVSSINMAEVYHWILKYYDLRTAERKRATIERRCFVIPVDKNVAIEAAKIKQDRGLALADSIVLATARLSGARILTGDEDFKEIAEAIFIGR